MEVLLESESGRSQLLSSPLDALFPFFDISALRSTLEKLPYAVHPPITVYGREAHQPRDIIFLSDESAGYRYSGQFMHSTSFDDASLIILDLMRYVNLAFDASFNGVLINRYVNGDDCLGAHSDEETDLDPTAGVVSISLGATRIFRVREKRAHESPRKRAKGTRVHQSIAKVSTRMINDRIASFDVPLRDKQLVVMRGDFQKEYTHEIPRQKKICAVRYNLTFRCHKK